MAWTTGTCADYRDLLAQIRVFAAANGWTVLRNTTTFSWNSITDEREVVLRGDCGTATLPHVGFRTFTETGSVQGILLAGFSGYNAGAFGSLPSASPVTSPSASGGTYIPVLSGGGTFWLSVTKRRIAGVYKAAGGVTAYISFYAGLLNSFRSEVEDEFPFFLGSSCAVSTQAPDSAGANVTGIVEAASPSGVAGPCYWYRSDDASWQQVRNSEAGAADDNFVLWPFGKPKAFAGGGAKEIVTMSTLTHWEGIVKLDRSSATRSLKPSPDSGGNIYLPWPVTLISTPDGTGSANDFVVGELHGVHWISTGGTLVAEDTVTYGGRTFRVFKNGAQTEPYQFFVLEQA